jgi:cell shape-determining protein MreD
MAVLIAIPILGGLAIIQSAIVSMMPLLLGSADLVMIAILAWALQDHTETIWQWSLIGGIIMSFVSGITFGVYIGAYLIATMTARLIRRRVWKVPFLGMLAATFLGTLFVHLASWLSRWLTGVYIPLDQVFNLITLPSILINLIIAVPAFFLMRDLAGWLYPEEIEV